MKVAYLDTQAAVWLTQGKKKKVSTKALAAIERYELRLSPIVRLEFQYLWEVRRIDRRPEEILDLLFEQLDVRICEASFESICIAASRESWTRDVFDRMIVANARSMGESYLISADGMIAEHYPYAIW